MNDERNIEINSPNYTYSGKMTRVELSREALKRSIAAADVRIDGLVMYDWSEVHMLWAATSEKGPNVTFNDEEY